jgi:hypothetical protein
MNLGQFHSLVTAEVKRGNSLDNIIPLRVELAVKFLERNFSYGYMGRRIEVLLDPSVADPKHVALGADVKAVKWLRYTQPESGNYFYLTKEDAQLQVAAGAGYATTYSLVGDDSIVLDKTPTAIYTLEGEVFFYTDWSQDALAEHWILRNAPDLLLSQTMLGIGNYLRDMQMIQHYRGARDEALKTSLLAEDAADYDGINTEMAYSPAYGPAGS